MSTQHLVSCLCAVAPLGLLSTAHAQTWTWHADIANPVLDPAIGLTTQEVTLSVSMEHDTPYYIVGFSIFDTLGSLDADQGQITDWTILNHLADLTGDMTTSDGVSLYNTYIGQLCTFTVCNHDNPLDVLTFTWEYEGDTPEAPFEVSYETLTYEASIWAGKDQDTAVTVPVEILHEAQVTWTVLPSPASLALAPFSLLVTRRRRRSNGDRAHH